MMEEGRVVFLIGPDFCHHEGFHHLSAGQYDERDFAEIFSKEAWYGESFREIRRRRLMDCLDIIRKKIENSTPLKPFRQIVQMQKDYQVSIITQNIDDFLERAGGRDIIHIYGEAFLAKDGILTSGNDSPGILLWGEEIPSATLSTVLNKIYSAGVIVVAGWDNAMPMAERIVKSASQRTEVYFLGKDSSVVPTNYYRSYSFLDVRKWDAALDIIKSWLFT